MKKFKDLLMSIEDENDLDENSIEVYADSVKQALELAAEDLDVDITMLDYDVLEKGTKGLFGVGRLPYRVLITLLKDNSEHDDLDELEKKLAGDHLPGLTVEKKDVDSTFKVRVTKTGIWFTVIPAKGKGKPVDIMAVNNKLYSMRLTTVDMSLIEKEIKTLSGLPVKIGEWKPNPEYDGSMSVEVSEDEMKAFVHFTPPRYSGRHMELDEVLDAIKKAGVIFGIKEKDISEYLENMDYTRPLLAAEGQYPKNGNDASIDYKVRVDKSKVSFEEDESGKVDFKSLELLENVVVGQLLALKIPAEEGVPGRTLTNKILPAKSGKDMNLQFGKGTILSEDGTELTAEINGQVVFKANKISVEPIYVVQGDVSLETGNVIFLGSVIVTGNVQDNFVVKAAGNIEVKGTVQKAFLEAEGDIIVHQGISGREEAKIESTGGSIFAKFIQNANISANKDVIVPEGVIHSNVDAGANIFSNGRRARIVGGLIRAGVEINARFLGAEAFTKTEIMAGIDPKVLQQMSELDQAKNDVGEELEQIKLDVKTLTTQKKRGKFSEEKSKHLDELTEREEKLTNRLSEIEGEVEDLNSYMLMLEHKGKISAEKTVFPGVDISVDEGIFNKKKRFTVKDNYNHVTFSMEGGEIKISDYQPPEMEDGKQRIATIVPRRF